MLTSWGPPGAAAEGSGTALGLISTPDEYFIPGLPCEGFGPLPLLPEDPKQLESNGQLTKNAINLYNFHFSMEHLSQMVTI